MKYIKRVKYLDELILLKDKHFIKVVTGVRRSGKSTILEQYIEIIKKQGIDEKQIIQFDFNNKLLKDKYKRWQTLTRHIINIATKNKINYLFLDEIQDIKKFEECVITLFESKSLKFDIYLTGSNSKMFSSKLATLFTGRNLEIKVIPLSFKEYHDYYLKNYVRGEYDTRKVFNLFLKYGGLPILLEDLQSEQTIEKELSSILKDTIKKDVKSRHTIKNITEFNHVAKYVFNNIGTQISSWNIANYMKTNNNSRIEHKTIDRYLEWMQEALLIYRINLYNTKGKRVLNTSGKYYSVDLGIRNSQDKYETWQSGLCLENLVYLELIRREYEVYAGRLRNGEIDFVCKNNKGDITYIQVTKTLKDGEDKKLWDREVGNLASIKDNFEKIVISYEDQNKILHNGIKIVNLIDWLLESND